MCACVQSPPSHVFQVGSREMTILRRAAESRKKPTKSESMLSESMATCFQGSAAVGSGGHSRWRFIPAIRLSFRWILERDRVLVVTGGYDDHLQPGGKALRYEVFDRGARVNDWGEAQPAMRQIVL